MIGSESLTHLGDWRYHVSFLARLFAKHRPLSGLELGVCCGVSLSLFATITPYCSWVGVDRWEDPNQQEEAIRATLDKDVTLYRGKFQQMANSLPLRNGFGVVHIDGDHDYYSVTRDVQLARSLLAPEGIILMHDILHPYTEVKDVWHEIKSKYTTLESPSECGLGAFFPHSPLATVE